MRERALLSNWSRRKGVLTLGFFLALFSHGINMGGIVFRREDDGEMGYWVLMTFSRRYSSILFECTQFHTCTSIL